MKPPKSKMHLASSADPLHEGETIIALCKAEVSRARFVIHWDESEPLELSELYDAIAWMTCTDCMKVEIEERYLYGIKSAEEVSEEGSTCQTS